jgi:toxin ParE1/3/4
LARLRISDRAGGHIRAITAYTRDRWGEAQARAYVSGLRQKCQDMADAPSQAPEFSKGVRRFFFGSHAVFFREHPNGIEIIAVLHQRQLPDLD